MVEDHCLGRQNKVYLNMLEINPKKFKHIQNKTIPSPLRPKFRNSRETNMYFISKKRFEGKKKDMLIKRVKFGVSILIIAIGGYLLSI